jgi:hypothetical protein
MKKLSVGAWITCVAVALAIVFPSFGLSFRTAVPRKFFASPGWAVMRVR